MIDPMKWTACEKLYMQTHSDGFHPWGWIIGSMRMKHKPNCRPYLWEQLGIKLDDIANGMKILYKEDNK